MLINTYDDMQVHYIDRTPISSELIQFACDICMKKADDISRKSVSRTLAQNLIHSGHTSVLEHANMVLLARGISRSLLAQITRHRTFSFTSASQHYQNYSDYPMTISPWYSENKTFRNALNTAMNYYTQLIEEGVPPEEARQVLPNASTVNLLITGNIRAFLNFLEQRLCERNVFEMKLFANKVHSICKTWCPEVFTDFGPPCKSTGQCNQGKLSCKNG